MAMSPRQVYGGVPYSDAYQPLKSDIINLWDATLFKQTAANAGALIADSKADLDLLAPTEGSMAWVIGDANPDLDGVYQYSGGTWTKRGPLPYGVIHLNNAGAGTGDAIEVTTAFGLPDAAYGVVYSLNITHPNDGPVTISINDQPAVPLVSNTGAALDPGALQAGMQLLALDDGTSFRLFVYANAEAILAGAEAARDEAQAAAASISLKQVPDRTSLASVDTVANGLAYLTESGREGPFVPVNDNLSVEVAADTTQSTFVPFAADPTGASGAWVRRRKGPVLITEAGVSEIGDPATNSQLIESLMDYFSLTGISGGELVVPYGTFEFAKHTDGAAFRLGSGVTLMGFGPKSIIRLADDQNDTFIVRPFADSGGIRMKNLCLDGNRSGQSAPTGLLHGFVGAPNCKNVRLRDVLIVDVYERAFMSNLGIDLDERDSYDFHLAGCRAVNFGGKAWQFSRTAGGSMVGNYAHSVDADSSAFEVSRSEGVSVSANTSVDEGTGVNHYRIVNGSENVEVSGNNGEGGNRLLFATNCVGVSLTGNTGRNLAGDGAFIQHEDTDGLGWSCRDISLTANKFLGYGGAGVRIDIGPNGTAVEDVDVHINTFRDGPTGIELTPGENIGVRQSLNRFTNVPIPLIGAFQPNPSLLTDGVSSGRIESLADDTSIAINCPDASGGIFEFVVDTIAQYAAAVSYRAEAGVERAEFAWNITPETITKSTGALTGTTGADGTITVSASNGVIYIENRTGFSRSFQYLFKCVRVI